MFWVVTPGHLAVEARNAGKHPTMTRSVPQHRIIPPQKPVVPKVRKPAVCAEYIDQWSNLPSINKALGLITSTSKKKSKTHNLLLSNKTKARHYFKTRCSGIRLRLSY
jgi:hypothetical protein